MVVSPVSVVKHPQTCFSAMSTCIITQCNITYCKCIAWVLSLCNTSWLNTKTTGFEILPSMILYLPRSRCAGVLVLKNLEWSTFPVDTGRKLNVHKAFRRRSLFFGLSSRPLLFNMCVSSAPLLSLTSLLLLGYLQLSRTVLIFVLNFDVLFFPGFGYKH